METSFFDIPGLAGQEGGRVRVKPSMGDASRGDGAAQRGGVRSVTGSVDCSSDWARVVKND